MKYILLIIIAIASLSSCRKITAKCWDCTIKSYSNGSLILSKGHRECDKTKAEIKEFEKKQTFGDTKNGMTVTCE